MQIAGLYKTEEALKDLRIPEAPADGTSEAHGWHKSELSGKPAFLVRESAPNLSQKGLNIAPILFGQGTCG